MTARMTIPDKLVHICPVRDLGLGGLYLEVETRLRPGQSCALVLQLSSKPDRPGIEVSSQVVRVEPGRGAALEFTELSLEAFDQLDRIIFDSAPIPPSQPTLRRSS